MKPRGAVVCLVGTARGADSRRLVMEGFGKTVPIASNATIEGRAAHRRVEIVLHARTS